MKYKHSFYKWLFFSVSINDENVLSFFINMYRLLYTNKNTGRRHRVTSCVKAQNFVPLQSDNEERVVSELAVDAKKRLVHLLSCKVSTRTLWHPGPLDTLQRSLRQEVGRGTGNQGGQGHVVGSMF